MNASPRKGRARMEEELNCVLKGRKTLVFQTKSKVQKVDEGQETERIKEGKSVRKK